MAPFFHEVSGHGEAHHAETEESDFSHVWYLVRSLGFTVFAGRGGAWFRYEGGLTERTINP